MAEQEEEKKQYRVKAGRVFGAKDEYKQGDTVELTEAEAEAFLDKLEPLESAQVSRPTPRIGEPKPARARLTRKRKTEE